MTEESIFYDHYKDSFEQQKCYLAKRDKLTAIILVLMTLMVGFIYDPSLASSKINTAIQTSFENLSFDFKHLNTALIFLSLWCILQYYQVVIQIEKMYDYIKLCEQKLSTTGDYKVSREGDFYQKKNKLFGKLTDFCYVYMFPSAIIAIAIFKVVKEWTWSTNFKIIDSVGLGFIIAFSILYIIVRKTMKHATEL